MIFDAGGVILTPRDIPFERFHHAVGIKYAKDSGPRALATAVVAGAATRDPIDFWCGSGKSISLATSLGLNSHHGTHLWQSINECMHSLWCSADPSSHWVLKSVRTDGVRIRLLSNSNGTYRPTRRTCCNLTPRRAHGFQRMTIAFTLAGSLRPACNASSASSRPKRPVIMAPGSTFPVATRSIAAGYVFA
jgi:hypothetical protein